MTDLTVPTVPPLARVPHIELMHVGQWELSTGPAYFTADDLALAVAALDCPAVRRPILKLGHTDPRFDGEPAVGWVENLAVEAGGSTLVGDYAGMPGWLGQIVASAYPDRSVEGYYDLRCQIGHVHPFVVTAVALLGCTPPGIGTLESLQDVAALYGVAAAPGAKPDETPFRTVRAAQEATVPNPRPKQVSAAVTTDDVRSAYYEIAPWSVWIEEIQIDTLQLLTIDDDTREWFLVPIVLGTGDGEEAVSFGDPVKVQRTFTPVTDAVAASTRQQRLVFASRAESRPGQKPPTTPAASAAGQGTAGATTTPEEADGMSDTLLEGLRKQLGLADDADEATILAANAQALEERAEQPAAPVVEEPSAPTALPDGTVAVDEETWQQTVAAAQAGAAAREEQLTVRREQLVKAAIGDGRIAPSRKDHWLASLKADPGSETVLAALQPGTVPVEEIGHSEGDDVTNVDSVRASAAYKNWSIA